MSLFLGRWNGSERVSSTTYFFLNPGGQTRLRASTPNDEYAESYQRKCFLTVPGKPLTRLLAASASAARSGLGTPKGNDPGDVGSTFGRGVSWLGSRRWVSR